MTDLKLMALDAQDLTVVSAHVQDALTKPVDLAFLPREKRFVLPLNRYAWEKPVGLLKGTPERRASVLSFDRVLKASRSGFPRSGDEVLSLLAVNFIAGEAPGGTIELIFSGTARVRLEVEVVEARLADLGGAWQASSRPHHAA